MRFVVLPVLAPALREGFFLGVLREPRDEVGMASGDALFLKCFGHFGNELKQSEASIDETVALARLLAEGRRLGKRADSIKHHGPHSLRHACATRLINEGLSLKEISDHLGQRDLEATRIYAKVDLVQLREVANFDLGELL
jgi:integrase